MRGEEVFEKQQTFVPGVVEGQEGEKDMYLSASSFFLEGQYSI